jgi:heavy metal sensor kinase
MVSAPVHAAAMTGPPRTYTAAFGDDGQEFRVRVSSFRDRGQVRVLVLGESLQPVEDAVNRVLLLLTIAGPAAIAITALIAYWLAHKALQPVERITSDADDIGIDRLNERVAVPDSHDETRRLAVTLNAMLERIEQGVLERHRLVADASHELRTPLAVMRSEIDVTLGADKLSPETREVLGSVREEVDRMARTIENLLTLAQADEGRLELLTRPLDLRQVAEDAARTLQPLVSAKGQSLQVEGGHEQVQADPPRILLVMTNLIENAIKFSPDGGVIKVASWRREGEVGISVTDDGPGIPVPDRERLFDRFYRADNARGRATDGSGLGLAICREVAAAHGGRIWVDAAPGGGSVFSLALPAWRSLQPHDARRSTPLAGGA